MFERLIHQDPLTLLSAGAGFVLILCLWLMAVLFWARRRTGREQVVDRRLGIGTERPESEAAQRTLRLWHDGKETTTIVPGAKPSRSPVRRLEQMLRDAGWDPQTRMTVYTILGVCPLACAAATLLVLGTALPGIGVAAAVYLIFWIYLKSRISRRAELFDLQLVEALELAARSLRAGHPFSGAFRLISEEFPPPVGAVFTEICQQLDMGMSLEAALQKAAAATPSEDMKLLATSVIIQIQSGGNLADMMDRAAYVIRDRMRLSRRVRVLTAQTQFSKRILLGLPFLVFVVLNVVNYDYMQPFYTTYAGSVILIVALVCLLLGAWVMNRIAILKY